ncbi:hypothetical protein LY78DRAFT_651185 [Colletotrichum sublineola]|nr:hypothetical protein LY78DRAFT_651185 [Colletotrichum sublineola]
MRHQSSQIRLESKQDQYSIDSTSILSDRRAGKLPTRLSRQHSGPPPPLSQTSVATTGLAPKIGDEDVVIDPHEASAIAETSEGVVSNEPLLDGSTSSVTESENDPYREPQTIPNHRPPIFVYPYSGDKIPLLFQQRFQELVNLFMYNTRNNAQLRDSAPFIDYTLRMCGQSPGDSHPSILVFCRPRDFQPLKDVLFNDRLRVQYCRRLPAAKGTWKLGQLRGELLPQITTYRYSICFSGTASSQESFFRNKKQNFSSSRDHSILAKNMVYRCAPLE